MKKCAECDRHHTCRYYVEGVEDYAHIRTIGNERIECKHWSGWHNIIDDTSDLPTDGGNFLVFVRGDIYYTCNDCTAEKFADYVRNGNVLKWKYIEEA